MQGGRRNWSHFDKKQPLKWEAVNFRGADNDIADLEVTGFGDRVLQFGEGSIVLSPADPGLRLNLVSPSEDDVLHAASLPTFGDTISHEESELLMSYLTVDYVRLPLVLSFFASRDRMTYLFSSDLQNLLRAVIFEPGLWVSRDPSAFAADIQDIPARKSRAQEASDRSDRVLFANLPPERQQLGTPVGFLFNELRCSPTASYDPLLYMLQGTKELSECSVYSPDAAFLLFVLQLTVDMQAYLVAVLQEARRAEVPVKTASGELLVQVLTAINGNIVIYLQGNYNSFKSLVLVFNLNFPTPHPPPPTPSLPRPPCLNYGKNLLFTYFTGGYWKRKPGKTSPRPVWFTRTSPSSFPTSVTQN